jgi:hypothetical protein
MEYKELREKTQAMPVDVPDTDTIITGMHRTIQRRRQRQTLLAAAACILLAIMPLTMTVGGNSAKPTLAESVSATLPSSPDDLPAPLAGYRNSLRNHQIHTVI